LHWHWLDVMGLAGEVQETDVQRRGSTCAQCLGGPNPYGKEVSGVEDGAR
jgi:hypothetical protein